MFASIFEKTLSISEFSKVNSSPKSLWETKAHLWIIASEVVKITKFERALIQKNLRSYRGWARLKVHWKISLSKSGGAENWKRTIVSVFPDFVVLQWLFFKNYSLTGFLRFVGFANPYSMGPLGQKFPSSLLWKITGKFLMLSGRL